MSSRHLTPVIEIAPPIPYADLTAKADTDINERHAAGYPVYRYLFDGIDIGDLTFGIDRNHPNGPCATAIFAWKRQPINGYYRRAALTRVVNDFARTSDGTARDFDGHLTCERHGEPSRLYIRQGELIEVTPELVWHEPPATAPTTSHMHEGQRQ
jgi:hypothetical protein